MRQPRLFTVALFLLSGAAVSRAATFTVNTTNDLDDGSCNVAHCSLREAIVAANATVGADTIRFAIGSGPKTIQPTSALPTITDPVTIDGTTQPGFPGTPIIELDGSNAGLGTNGLRITAGGSVVTGLVINRFLPAFPSTGGHGIVLEDGGGNVVRGCYVGTNAAGTAAEPNGGDGVRIDGSPNNLVGRTDTSTRINVLSGNSVYGVRILGAGADGNTVAGNRIGTNAAGTGAVPNSGAGVAVLAGAGNVVGSGIPGDTLVSGNDGDGIYVAGSAAGTVVKNCWVGVNPAGTAALANTGQGVDLTGVSGATVGPGNVVSGNLQSGVLLISGASGNTITANFVGLNAAGTAAVGNTLNGIIGSGADDNTIGPSNVVSGNGTNGIRLRNGASGNVVFGNFVGVDASAAAAVPNLAEGVQLNENASDNTIGGTTAERNVISGNGGNGVLIVDAGTIGNVVSGNFIGSNATASAGIPNAANGVAIMSGASGNVVGGTAVGTKNIISFNGARGVFVESGAGNSILGNTISFNALLGIDLGAVGVTPNDSGDPDPGANLLQNFPVLSAVLLDVATTQIQGTLNSIASASYRLEFFSSIVCDASGNGPGQRFLGFADRKTDPGGNVAFVTVVPSSVLGPWITATATDAAGNTSEFSACLAVPGPTVASIAPDSGAAGTPAAVSIGGTNFQSGAGVAIGGTPAGGVAVVSGAEIDATTPLLPPGTLNDVTVTNPSSLAATLSGGYFADFVDVPEGNIFHDDVETVFRAGITAGCGGGAFCVSSAVTRAQMAVFLLKAEHGSAYLPPDCQGVFADVPCSSPFSDWIEQLAAEGVTVGCGGGNYCPDNPVRRDQMAVFLLKTKNGPAYEPPTCADVFGDVECPSPFADWIEALYAAGITGGCSTDPLLYCPASPNTRGQMAVFLTKTFELGGP